MNQNENDIVAALQTKFKDTSVQVQPEQLGRGLERLLDAIEAVVGFVHRDLEPTRLPTHARRQLLRFGHDQTVARCRGPRRSGPGASGTLVGSGSAASS